MRAGVISVQGAAPEHLLALERAMFSMGIDGKAVPIRRRSDLERSDCIIIPGGESTTISKLLNRFDLHGPLVKMASDGVPIMGTCAGCVLMAKQGDQQVERTDTRLLGLIDMSVDRNAFGRQRDSFEAMLDIKGLNEPFQAVFIRAPEISRTWGECEVLAKYQGHVVMVRQKNLWALSFHPELSSDLRVHEMFLTSCR